MRAFVQLVFLSLIIAAAVHSQAPAPPKSTVAPAQATAAIPLTDHETAQYRSAQIRVVKAQIAIAADQLWKELQAAQAELNMLPAQFISSRKLDAATHGLCDGPVKDVHACDGLVEGQLGIGTLAPVPAPTAKPAPAAEVKK